MDGVNKFWETSIAASDRAQRGLGGSFALDLETRGLGFGESMFLFLKRVFWVGGRPYFITYRRYHWMSMFYLSKSDALDCKFGDKNLES